MTRLRAWGLGFVSGTAAGLLASATMACAGLWATPQAADTEAQVMCSAEAGAGLTDAVAVKAAIDDCRCRVRERYPSGPQCTDAGVVSR